MKIKSFQAEVIKADSDQYDARFILSASTPDRVRDTIDPTAYDSVSKTVTKLIALFNHDSDRPVGFWEKLKREKDTLTASLKFAGTNLGKMLKQLLDDGVPLGASIGFRGSGQPNELGGIHFDSIELIETSIVSTPAHPRAMQIAKQWGIDLEQEIKPHNKAASGDPVILRANRAIIGAKRTIKGRRQ